MSLNLDAQTFSGADFDGSEENMPIRLPTNSR